MKLPINNSQIVIQNLTLDSLPYLICEIMKNNKFPFMLHIVADNEEMKLFEKEINFYSKDLIVLKMPEWNIFPFDVSSPNINISAQKMKCIYDLINLKKNAHDKQIILLVTKNSMIQKIINYKDFHCNLITKGQNFSKNDLISILENNFYEKVETSTYIGNYSVNNNIIDFVTLNNISYRVFIDDNIIKNIQHFELETQISYDSLSEIIILPIREIIISNANLQNFKNNYRKYFNTFTKNDIFYHNIVEKFIYDGIENWLPFFYNNKLFSIFDYLPFKSIIAFNSDILHLITNFLENIQTNYELRNNDLINSYNCVEPSLLYLNLEEYKNHLLKYPNIIFDVARQYKTENIISANIESVPNFFSKNEEMILNLEKFIV